MENFDFDVPSIVGMEDDEYQEFKNKILDKKYTPDIIDSYDWYGAYPVVDGSDFVIGILYTDDEYIDTLDGAEDDTSAIYDEERDIFFIREVDRRPIKYKGV